MDKVTVKQARNAYHATYFYLASGMEGHPDTADYGIVYAKDDEDAQAQAEVLNGNSSWGLSVKLIKKNVSPQKKLVKKVEWVEIENN